ncbi:hypothetical protein SEA_DIZZYRUDY_36 [Microbacterium phage DizzyRudy]|nr:hypothetical protein SEA_DIZZYRUDY_36 [Microbacterium phage DizzyRudy]
MLKHIKPRDIVEFFLFAFVIMVLILVTGVLESAPLEQAVLVAIPLAIALWLTWFILIARERARDHRRPDLKIMVDGKWVSVDSKVGAQAFSAAYLQPRSATPVQIFDQDAHQKEQA